MSEVLNKIKEQLNLTPELQEKLHSMVEKYRDLNDEEKAEFTETVKESFESSINKYKSNFARGKFWGIAQSSVGLVIAIILLFAVFAFFGRKLYNSLMERERKREEKKKLKELKKKK